MSTLAEREGRSTRPLRRALRTLKLSTPLRYGLAIAFPIASILLRLMLEPAWDQKLPYITLFPAIALSGWLGGFGPGTVATLISGAAATYLWLEPARSWATTQPTEWLGLLMFTLIGCGLSILNEIWRRDSAALAESEQRLAVTLASIGEAVVTTDSSGRVASLNPAAEAMTGWSSAEAIGKPVDEVVVIVTEAREAVESSVQRVLRTGKATGLTNHSRLISRENREIPIDDSAAPIRAADGRVTGTVMVFRDVTERRRQASQSEVEFRLARELAAIVESSDDAIVSKNLESTIKSWNRSAERMFGYTAAEAVGKSIHIIIPEARWNEEEDVLARLREGQKIDHFETIRRRKDGREIPVSLTISPIHSPDGVVIGASKIARDISQQKQLERERTEILAREQEARVALEQANRIKDDFLAVLSHELRTPLNAILGYTHLLSSNLLPPDRVTHALQAIERNAHAQSRLLESLLDLSRIMAGKLELNLEEMDLVPVVRLAMETMRPQAHSKSVSLELVDAPSVPTFLLGDSARLQQVFLNLLSNAIKFTPSGGHVRVDVRPGPAEVEVRVADNGQGIGPSFLPHVFDRFTQEDRQRARSGLGLGLALVREMVQAHGGRVHVESPGEGRGSTFTVTLPLASARWFDSTDPHVAQSQRVGALSGLDLIVVDNEPDALELAVLVLTSSGANVRTAGSAAEAFDSLVRSTPDALLADIGMPDQDGYSLIRKYRAYERQHKKNRLPAVAVTAYASSQDTKRSLDEGYDLHVAKPVDFDVLIDSIARLARTSRL